MIEIIITTLLLAFVCLFCVASIWGVIDDVRRLK